MRQEVIRALHALAENDQPLAALRLAMHYGATVENSGAVLEFASELSGRLAHLESPDAYRAFYEERAKLWKTQDVSESGMPQLDPRQQAAVGVVYQYQCQTVLDLGCGDGSIAVTLAKMGKRVLAVDGTSAALEHTQELAKKCGTSVTVLKADLESFITDARFDAVLLCDVLEHIREVDPVLATAELHARPGHGLVTLTCPLKASFHETEEDAREHVRLIDEDWMREILRAPTRECVYYQQIPQGNGAHHIATYRVSR